MSSSLLTSAIADRFGVLGITVEFRELEKDSKLQEGALQERKKNDKCKHISIVGICIC